MPEVIETLTFSSWLSSLRDIKGRAKIVARIARIQLSGYFGDVENVGDGVSELRVHFGPGYRVYFCRRGAEIVILLGGGTRRPRPAISAPPKRPQRSFDP